MEQQLKFSDLEYSSKRKKTKKEIFLAKMDEFVPLDEWCNIIKPYYYMNGNGRQPTPLPVMLKMYLVSQWYTLSDEACEDLLAENLTVKKYVGYHGDAPDATTLCKFRHLLEKHSLAATLFNHFTALLKSKNIILSEGTIVDATIISAPQSTKNKDHARNPEMSSTKKGSNYYHGLKAHIGMDRDSGYVHSVATTTASIADIAAASKVLHGNEEEIHGDAGYVGIEKREEICELYHDESGVLEEIKKDGKKVFVLKKKENIKFTINKRRKSVKTDEEKELERIKSKVRCKVEHAFGTVKHIFGFRKSRYRTIAKNHTKLLMLFALANLLRYTRAQIAQKTGQTKVR